MLLRFLSFLLLCISLVMAATSTPFKLKDAKFTVQSIDGTARISKQFDASTPPDFPSSLSLQADDILRISFAVKGSKPAPPAAADSDSEVDSDSDSETDAKTNSKSTKSSVPHQVFVVLVDENDSSRQQTYVLPVKPSTGKATWSLRVDRLPPILSKSSGSLKLSLLLGSFENQISQSLSIASLNLPITVLKQSTDLTQRELLEIENSFKPHLERRHTFGIPPNESMPDSFISTGAALITLAAPWIVFLGLIFPISSSLSPKAPSTFSTLLLLCLLVLEGLALRFWIGGSFTLLKLLPYLIVVGILTLIIGRGALRELVGQRENVEKRSGLKDKKSE